MAKAVDKNQDQPGRGKANGKPAGKKAQSAKAPAKRGGSKPGKGKAQQKGRGGKPAEKRGFMRFLRDVRIEMGKVTWPTRKDLMQSTIVVLVAVAIATVYCLGLDTVFTLVVEQALKLIS